MSNAVEEANLASEERLMRERDEARAEVLDLVAEVGREHAEVERLREELDNCKGGGAYRDEVGSLTSENERLRAAVEKIRAIKPQPYSQHHAWVFLVRDVMNAIDAALDGERDE